MSGVEEIVKYLGCLANTYAEGTVQELVKSQLNTTIMQGIYYIKFKTFDFFKFGFIG